MMPDKDFDDAAAALEYDRVVADLQWWQSLLPPGWAIYGCDARFRASAFPPDGRRLVDLDAELLLAFDADRQRS